MNLIIDLIIKIFQTLFEEDRKRRGPVQHPPGARPQRPQRPQTVEDWLADIFGEEGARTATVQAPPPIPAQRKPIAPVTETLAEHIRKEEARSHRQEDRAKALNQHVHDYLGESAEDGKKQMSPHGDFKLPGNNPMQQALYAHIIFGPCKARRNLGGRFQNL